MSPRHLLLAIAIAAAWGSNFVAIHYGLAGVPPLALATLRFLLCALPVLVLYRDGPRVPWRLLVIASLTSGVVQFAFLFTGMEEGMPAGLSSLVVQVQALFTIGIAALVLGERPSRGQLAGVAIAIGGLALIGWSRAASGVALWPFLFLLIGSLGWSAGNVATRMARPADGLRFVCWWSVLPPAPLLGLAVARDGTGVVQETAHGLGAAAVLGLLYIVVVSTFFGYAAWNRLLALYPASTVAPFTLLVPIFGILSAWAVLGERPTLPELVGGIAILAGLFVATRLAGRPLVAAGE